MPHLVEMQRKHEKDGLVVVTVSLDEPGDAEARARALRFLTEKARAYLPNFLLDEPPEVWQEKLKVAAPPLVFVFNRDNRIVLKMGETGAVDLAVVEKTVEELLKK